MLAMSTLMMPAPTMALGAPQLAVGPHKPHETKLLAIHPAHSQPQTTQQQGNDNEIVVLQCNNDVVAHSVPRSLNAGPSLLYGLCLCV